MPNIEPEVQTEQHVVVGIVIDGAGKVLVSKRASHVHEGNKWEFPGGKVESGENAYNALCRELDEELGIRVTKGTPWLHVKHRYPEKKVWLDVWRVQDFDGIASGKEGQAVRWISPDELVVTEFPEANLGIIRAMDLPSLYAISAAHRLGKEQFLKSLDIALKEGLRLVQLREPDLSRNEYVLLAREVSQLCHQHDARVLVNAEPEMVDICDADGVHLNSRQLAELNSRPLGPELLVAGSCHNEEEIRNARQLGVDFIVVSPVLHTKTHPDTKPLGWEEFERLCALATMPVYALGGMKQELTDHARSVGAQGVAMLSGVWKS